MLDTIDRLRANAYGQLIEKYALAADWGRMRRLEQHWVSFSTQYHGRDRTEVCQTELDARLSVRFQWEHRLRHKGTSKPDAAYG